MPCTPLNSSQFNPPISNAGGFAVPLPNLNIPFSPVNLPDLSDLYNVLELLTPIGPMKPNWGPELVNNIYTGINDLLAKFSPFLSMYQFFLPLLNLILCIIEVICALINPFKLANAVIKLFRTCIPEFLALFPFFAMIIMIISYYYY